MTKIDAFTPRGLAILSNRMTTDTDFSNITDTGDLMYMKFLNSAGNYILSRVFETTWDYGSLQPIEMDQTISTYTDLDYSVDHDEVTATIMTYLSPMKYYVDSSETETRVTSTFTCTQVDLLNRAKETVAQVPLAASESIPATTGSFYSLDLYVSNDNNNMRSKFTINGLLGSLKRIIVDGASDDSSRPFAYIGIGKTGAYNDNKFDISYGYDGSYSSNAPGNTDTFGGTDAEDAWYIGHDLDEDFDAINFTIDTALVPVAGTRAIIYAEYYNEDGTWHPLEGVEDETEIFTVSGTIRFSRPFDMKFADPDEIFASSTQGKYVRFTLINDITTAPVIDSGDVYIYSYQNDSSNNALAEETKRKPSDLGSISKLHSSVLSAQFAYDDMEFDDFDSDNRLQSTSKATVGESGVVSTPIISHDSMIDINPVRSVPLNTTTGEFDFTGLSNEVPHYVYSILDSTTGKSYNISDGRVYNYNSGDDTFLVSIWDIGEALDDTVTHVDITFLPKYISPVADDGSAVSNIYNVRGNSSGLISPSKAYFFQSEYKPGDNDNQFFENFSIRNTPEKIMTDLSSNDWDITGMEPISAGSFSDVSRRTHRFKYDTFYYVNGRYPFFMFNFELRDGVEMSDTGFMLDVWAATRDTKGYKNGYEVYIWANGDESSSKIEERVSKWIPVASLSGSQSAIKNIELTSSSRSSNFSFDYVTDEDGNRTSRYVHNNMVHLLVQGAGKSNNPETGSRTRVVNSVYYNKDFQKQLHEKGFISQEDANDNQRVLLQRSSFMTINYIAMKGSPVATEDVYSYTFRKGIDYVYDEDNTRLEWLNDGTEIGPTIEGNYYYSVIPKSRIGSHKEVYYFSAAPASNTDAVVYTKYEPISKDNVFIRTKKSGESSDPKKGGITISEVGWDKDAIYDFSEESIHSTATSGGNGAGFVQFTTDTQSWSGSPVAYESIEVIYYYIIKPSITYTFTTDNGLLMTRSVHWKNDTNPERNLMKGDGLRIIQNISCDNYRGL